MTVREAAQHLRVSPTSIHNYISNRQLPAIRLGRAVRIQPADLASFIARHRHNGKDLCTT
jgi:excisionase family DNA binding protein